MENDIEKTRAEEIAKLENHNCGGNLIVDFYAFEGYRLICEQCGVETQWFNRIPKSEAGA